MNLPEAWDKVTRILVEERMRPTVGYYDRIFEWRKANPDKPYDPDVLEILNRWKTLYANPRLNLNKDRQFRPRHVHKYPGEYVFKSDNFDLLTIIFGQLSEEDREGLIHILSKKLFDGHSFVRTDNSSTFPSYRNFVSELPLILEFMVRRGHASKVFEAISDINNITITLVIAFLALEDMLALNFTLFSDAELKDLSNRLHPVLKFSSGIAKASLPSSKPDKDRGIYARELVQSIRGLMEECRTARHYYLQEALLNENPNLEIEGDKKKLTDSLSSLGFDPLLMQSLRKAEDLYRPTSDGFDLKSCIGFMRSFLEQLHVGAARAVAQGTATVEEWNPATGYLRSKDVLTEQQEKLARGLWALLSDEGVHRIVTERESCRLSRNMTIEYGVMFLSVLEKKGVKIIAAQGQTNTGTQP
jgi:hypothetical protein